MVAYFAEKSTTRPAWKVDIHVVVLAADGFLYEWFLHDLSVDDDRVSVFAERDFRSDLESAEGETDSFFHEFTKFIVNLGTTVARHFKSSWGWYTQVIEYCAHQSTVPKKCLWWEVVDAVWLAKFDIRDGLVERKVGGEKRDENVAARPILDVCRGTRRVR